MALKTRIRYPSNILVSFKVLCNGQCVACMPLAAQTQGFHTEQELLSTKRAHARAEIAQDFYSDSDDKRKRSKCVDEFEPMVAFCRVVELGESLCVRSPVKLSRIDDDATNRCSVATNPLCGAVDDDVGAVLERLAVIPCSPEGVVHYKGNALSVSNLSDCLEVWHIISW